MEPTKIYAGDTVTWSRAVNGYSAVAGDTLAYSFNAKDQRFGAANTGLETGAEFEMSLSGTVTAKIAPGRYAWTAFATTDSARAPVASGMLDVLPNLLDGKPFDVRSNARKVLDAIDAVIERRATKDQESYTVEGRSLIRTPIPQLLVLRDRYAGIVQSEDTAANLAAGIGGNPRHIHTRFNRG